MDYSKTQVFNISGNKIENQSIKREFIERDVQKFYEENLEELLGAELIKSEYSIEGGRLDTFAIDQDNRPVIIEYKRDTSDSVLLQALFYKNYIRKNWEKAYMTIKDVKGIEIADEIDFTNIRVILVAQSYDKWTVASTAFLNGVELYSFAFFEDTFIQEFLNCSKDKTKTFRKIKKIENKSYVEVIDADYSIDEYVISHSGKKNQTNTGAYNSLEEKFKLLFQKISDFNFENMPQTELIYNRYYWMFKTKRKYIEVKFENDGIKVKLNLPKDYELVTLKFSKTKWAWGSLQYCIKVIEESDLDELFELIKISYKLTNKNQ